jgi:mannose/fructose-specific phosphotransferase system component IIA
MLLKLSALRNRSMELHEMAVGLAEAGRKSIRVASEFLRKRSSHGGGS